MKKIISNENYVGTTITTPITVSLVQKNTIVHARLFFEIYFASTPNDDISIDGLEVETWFVKLLNNKLLVSASDIGMFSEVPQFVLPVNKTDVNYIINLVRTILQEKLTGSATELSICVDLEYINGL